MTILSGGNVGIGTTSPSTELEVTGTIKSSGPIWSASGSTSTLRRLLLENYDDTANTNGIDMGIKLGGTEFQGLSWAQETAWTSGSASSAKDAMIQFGVLKDNTPSIPMVINSEGNVGIGTTVSIEKLEVRGTGSALCPAGYTIVF